MENKVIPTIRSRHNTTLPVVEQTRLQKKVCRLYINKEFIEFIAEEISSVKHPNKLVYLHFFKKLALQVHRIPDPEHYKAFSDKYEEELSDIAEEQIFFDLVKWINAEIEYLNSVSEPTKTDTSLIEVSKEQPKVNKEWFTFDEIRDMFGISKSTLNRRVAEGMPVKKIGKKPCFNLTDISTWIKEVA